MDRPLDSILAAVVNWAGDAIEITDEQARIIYVNKAFEDMTGFLLPEIEGKTPAQFLRSPLQDPEIYQEMWAAVSARNHWQGRITRRIKSGEDRPFQITVAPCLEDDGSVRNMIAISRDISLQIEEENRKMKLLEQVAYLQKMESLGRLAGRFAHDFNNLLTIISGNVDLALCEVSGQVAEYLEDSLKAANRAADLTFQMLTYAGGGSTRMKEMQLNQVIRETESLLRVPLPRNIKLELDLEQDLPKINGDQTQVSQILLNLINNGSEAIGNQYGRIKLSSRRIHLARSRRSQLFPEQDLPAGHYVRLVVADDGPGIPPAIISKIFDPFFSSKRGGHGLGLSSVMGIVKSHFGDISVKSTQGEGTEISILFPAAAFDAPAPVQAQKEIPKLALVVDDDELVRRVFAKGLELMGFNTLQAVDGLDGWNLFQEQSEKIDLVVLDMKMPNMDGLALFRLIHASAPQKKVIACSGFRDSEQEFNGGPAPNAFLVKPFTIKQLSECVKNLATAGSQQD